jgi:hypothetical protein
VLDHPLNNTDQPEGDYEVVTRPVKFYEIHNYRDDAGRQVTELKPSDGGESTFMGGINVRVQNEKGQQGHIPTSFAIVADNAEEAFFVFDTEAKCAAKRVLEKAREELNKPRIVVPELQQRPRFEGYKPRNRF